MGVLYVHPFALPSRVGPPHMLMQHAFPTDTRDYEVRPLSSAGTGASGGAKWRKRSAGSRCEATPSRWARTAARRAARNAHPPPSPCRCQASPNRACIGTRSVEWTSPRVGLTERSAAAICFFEYYWRPSPYYRPIRPPIVVRTDVRASPTHRLFSAVTRVAVCLSGLLLERRVA